MSHAISPSMDSGELLKQERLSPLSIEGDMAWLIAYALGLFDKVPKDRLPGMMERLVAKVSAGGLTLDDGEERWRQSVTAWCEEWTANEQTA